MCITLYSYKDIKEMIKMVNNYVIKRSGSSPSLQGGVPVQEL